MLSEEDRAYIESLVPDLNLDEINELCTIINHQKNNYFSGKISLLNKLKSEKRRILEEMASIKAELEAEANKLKLAGNIRQSREYYEIINEPNLGMQMNSCADLVHIVRKSLFCGKIHHYLHGLITGLLIRFQIKNNHYLFLIMEN